MEAGFFIYHGSFSSGLSDVSNVERILRFMTQINMTVFGNTRNYILQTKDG
jgi:hypothetical protein